MQFDIKYICLLLITHIISDKRINKQKLKKGNYYQRKGIVENGITE